MANSKIVNRQMREGPQYVTRTYLFSWVVEEDETNGEGRFTKQATVKLEPRPTATKE